MGFWVFVMLLFVIIFFLDEGRKIVGIFYGIGGYKLLDMFLVNC